MNTRRTRILIVVVVAAIIVSLFPRWDDAVRGFWDGFNDGRVTTTR